MTDDKKDIPKYWKVKTINELCSNIPLGQKKLKQKNYLNQGVFPVIDQGQTLIGGYTNDKGLLIDEEPPFIVFGDHTKVTKYIMTKFVAGADGVKVLKPHSSINPKFLFYAIRAIQLPDKGYARHFQFLNKAEIAYPSSLSEQKAIVEKIEEYFSELDKGIEELRTAQDQLKVYRQSLLNSSIIESKYRTIESVIHKLDQGWSPKCHNEASQNEEEWAVIKTTAVQSGFFDSSENKILPKNLEPRTKHELRVGDILITRAGPRIRVGVCCLIKKTRAKLLNCDKVYRVHVNEEIVTPEYFEFIINTPKYQSEIESIKTGISDSGVNLNQKQVLQIKIPVPSLIEQQKIVEVLEEKLSVCDQMEQTIIQSLQQAESLRQSILKQAFEGKLITVQEETPAYVPKKIPFYQAQLFGYIIDTSTKNNIDHGEMTLAKNAYLLDKIYGVPTYFNYQRWHLGPYPPEMKGVLNGGSLKQFFSRVDFHIELQNTEKLFKYSNPYESHAREAMEDLSSIISQYEDKERSYQTELLATVCKVIEDIQTTDLKAIRASMKEWKINLPNCSFKNKAEKFSESDTASCLNFIIARGWDKKLIN